MTGAEAHDDDLRERAPEAPTPRHQRWVLREIEPDRSRTGREVGVLHEGVQDPARNEVQGWPA
jgi:hypothetical protein